MSTKNSGRLGRTSTSEDGDTKAPLMESVIKHAVQNSSYTNIQSNPHPSLVSLKASLSKRRDTVVSDIICPKENVVPNVTGESISNQTRHVEEVVKIRKTSTSSEIYTECSRFINPVATSIQHGCLETPNSSPDEVTNTMQTAVASSLFSVNDEDDEELTAIFEYAQLHRNRVYEIQDRDHMTSATSLLCGRRNPAIPNSDILLTLLEDTHDSSVAKSSICCVDGEKTTVKILNSTDTGGIEADEIRKDSCIELVHRFANDTSLKCAAESAFSSLVNLR